MDKVEKRCSSLNCRLRLNNLSTVKSTMQVLTSRDAELYLKTGLRPFQTKETNEEEEDITIKAERGRVIKQHVKVTRLKTSDEDKKSAQSEQKITIVVLWCTLQTVTREKRILMCKENLI